MMSPAGEYILSIWYSCLSFHICTYLFFISSYHHLHVECVYFCNTHISSIDCHCHQHINNTCHPSILSPNIVDQLNSFGFGSLLKVHLSKISAIWFLILYIYIGMAFVMKHCVADTSWSRLSDTFTVSTAAPLTQELPSLPLLSRGSNRALFSLQSPEWSNRGLNIPPKTISSWAMASIL